MIKEGALRLLLFWMNSRCPQGYNRFVRKINPRILIAIILSLFDEIILLVMVLWVLPGFGIKLPGWLVILLGIMFLASGALTFIVVKNRPNLGFENQIGVKAIAVTVIGKNNGLVRIGRDNWTVRTEGSEIPPGSKIVVTGQNALILTVARDESDKSGLK
jgi:membrane protein implicated in regulation of membrane protease activity